MWTKNTLVIGLPWVGSQQHKPDDAELCSDPARQSKRTASELVLYRCACAMLHQ